MIARVLATIAALLVLGLVIVAVTAPKLAASRFRAMAHARGFDATWKDFTLQWPAGAKVDGLVLRRTENGDTAIVAERLDVALRPFALAGGHAEPERLTLANARIVLAGSRPGADSLADATEPDEDVSGQPVAPGVRAKADALVRALLVPARSFPELHLSGVELVRGSDEGVALTALDLTHEGPATNLAATGVIRGERDTPFDAVLRWEKDDRLTGRAQFHLAGGGGGPEALVLLVDGRVTQDRRAGEVRIADGTQVRIGKLAANLSGRVSTHGPRFTLDVVARDLTGDGFRQSLPADVLGPLSGLALEGSFDWLGGVDLDLARPDSVRFHADVVPHGLALDPYRSQPSLAELNGPFLARIHLPHDQVATREMSEANPHFRRLDQISPYLRDAVLTNEDGGFWRHRGFNTQAMGLALAANLRSGTYKRGAGTITMQLARNLWLGHQRTLSRKGQEVALAWLLEHESGLSKERLLEIYLNIIEWGPDIHGADEAARYFFDEDASSLSLSEALFLTIIVPSPSKWRGRLDASGHLRSYARHQMHFIAGKMASKGWLDPAFVPDADGIEIQLRGPARELFAPQEEYVEGDVTQGGLPVETPAETLAVAHHDEPPPFGPQPAKKKGRFRLPWWKKEPQ